MKEDIDNLVSKILKNNLGVFSFGYFDRKTFEINSMVPLTETQKIILKTYFEKYCEEYRKEDLFHKRFSKEELKEKLIESYFNDF